MSATSDDARSPAISAPRGARGRRADARRNIAAILDAALACLSRNPEASVGDIAAAAGIGRVTLYGHFPSRAELVEAVLCRTVEQAEQVLGGVDLAGDPREALARLVNSSWRHIDQYRALLVVAHRELSGERIRAHHDRPLRRIQPLIECGKRDGAFRSDLPTPWLVSTFYSVLHGAADEIAAGRLDAADAAPVITATLLAAFTPPGAPVPTAGAPTETPPTSPRG